MQPANPLCRARVLASASVAAVVLVATSSAQRQHVSGLIGEPPDVSNWPHPAAPDGNPFPRSTASASAITIRDIKVQLGKALFWEEQVSSDNTMACGTCHLFSSGGTDDRLGAVATNGNFGAFGVVPQAQNAFTSKIDYGFVSPASSQIDRLVTGLHTPTMVGAYVFEFQFWNKRAGRGFRDVNSPPFPQPPIFIPNFDDWASLEDQAVGPPISDVEMGHQNINWQSGFIQRKLGESFPMALVNPPSIPPDIKWLVTAKFDYDTIFDRIFFNDPQFGGIQGVTRERFGMAVAHYMRTLIPDQAPIDTGTMSSDMVAGFNLVSASGCFSCHSTSGSPTLATPTGKLVNAFDNPLSDGLLRNIGFGSVKTPTLRNVGLRKKFFSHGQGNGGVNTLDAIITFYDSQGGILGLNGSGPGGTLTATERKQVTEFLGSALTDKRVALELPPFDRPELASERSDFNPFEGNEYGNGTPGPSGFVPEIIANSPPLVLKLTPILIGTPPPVNHFKVGVGNALPGTSAILLVSASAGPGPVVWVGPAVGFGTSVVTNAQGIATIHTPFPLTTAAIGMTVFSQWMVLESGGQAFSDAATFTPFQF